MSKDVTVHTHPGDYPEIEVEFENDDGETFYVGFTRGQAEEFLQDLTDGLNELVEEGA